MNPIVWIEARIGSDVELRFSPQGLAIASFSAVTNDRVKEGDEWVDKNPTWFRCSVFRTMAENCAESLAKGDLVVIVGKLSQRDYENKDGEKKTSHQELAVDHIGPSLKFSTATINRAKRGGGGAQGNQDSDPWGSPAVGAGKGLPDDPPFAVRHTVVDLDFLRG